MTVSMSALVILTLDVFSMFAIVRRYSRSLSAEEFVANAPIEELLKVNAKAKMVVLLFDIAIVARFMP